MKAYNVMASVLFIRQLFHLVFNLSSTNYKNVVCLLKIMFFRAFVSVIQVNKTHFTFYVLQSVLFLSQLQRYGFHHVILRRSKNLNWDLKGKIHVKISKWLLVEIIWPRPPLFLRFTCLMHLSLEYLKIFRHILKGTFVCGRVYDFLIRESSAVL